VADTPGYWRTLDELEASVRVARDEQVETVQVEAVPMIDPRGRKPDQDWFAAGG